MNIARTDSYDFVVCGGGLTGFAAAISAARKGLKVALIEKNGILGGVATACGINQLLGGRKLNASNEHVRVVGGIFDELTDRLIDQGNAIEPNTVNLNFNPYGWYPRMASGISCNDTALKIMLDTMCREAGVRVYLNTTVVDVDKDERLRAVIIFNKDGFVRMEADSFADCTGDADVVHMCKLPYLKGRETDGLMTVTSVIMHVDNVDGNALVLYQNEHQSPKLVEIIERLKEEGKWKFNSDIFVTIQLAEEGVFLVNVVHQSKIDGTKEADISSAIADGRRECVELLEVMRAHFPGFQNARIRKVADSLGVRETRRMLGEYTVTVEDALSGKKYEDTVAATTYNFDLPDPIDKRRDAMLGDVRNPKAERKYDVIRIPYRAFLPQKIDNLIVAGRCVSVERDVLGAARVMGPCMMMGQVAGTAASMAKGDFKSVDVVNLRAMLWQDGLLNPDELPFA